ncbi:4-aminobutyrate transaminase [Acidocella aquatica]|uniref:4-aminobutyrate transaminase n=1 Tax=Acidocella aquatica TaxID=1922313 RepID=A0ABQ6AAH4_9PROT|nr:4-aminobutyrate--2-oxoglutarate transaminase [Acidocella aquatica]GLR67070.1 4-aminobutyrate transaminase [Acidocella aquatica]
MLNAASKPDTTQSNAAWDARRQAATPRGVSVLENFYAERALNAELWDIEGNRYIDFAGGIAVLNTGHCHPRVIAAVSEQLGRFSHTAYQVVPYAGYVSLAEQMNRRAPGAGAKKTILVTTGAEAVENAVKIARAATGRSGIIAFDGAFHGRTLLGMALTGKVAPYKTGFGAMPGDVFHAPFPNPLHGVSIEDSLAHVRRLFKSDIDPKRVAAFIYEPVQGEGGFYPAPVAFIRGLRQIADEHGILLIADEIQCGAARTGTFFASAQHDVTIDLLTFAKSIAAGLPLAGVVGRAELMDAAAPGGLGGTYAGNPLAVAAAHAVLEIIEDEKLEHRATVLGERLKARLNTLREAVPFIADVRGPGSMVAAEFINPKDGEPQAEFVKKVQAIAQQRGLILLICGVYSNVIRFLYPLTIQDSVFAEALDTLEYALRHA